MSAQDITGEKSTKTWKNLGTRFISGISLAAFCIVPFYFGGLFWVLLAVLFGILMIREWITISDENSTALAFILPVIGLITVLYFTYTGNMRSAIFAMIAGMVIVFFERLRRKGALWAALGFMYIVMPTAFIVALRGMETGIWAQAFQQIFFIIFMVIAADVGAYFGGSYFKGPKMAPRISPNKTWSGAISGVVAAMLVGVLCAVVMQFQILSGLIIGFVVAILSILGDILESAVKRRLEVKDAGALLPGHGGVLDRLDSLIFTIWVFGGALLLWPAIWPV